MRKWMIGLIALGVLAILFAAINSGHTIWVVLLMLAIIFYGLFSNPMKHVHESLKSEPAPRKKKRR